MNTPWGRSDSKITYGRGVSFVTTPSHGGFAITDRIARSRLSTAALIRSERRGGYHFFEEDCAAYIILWELDETRTTDSPSLNSILKGLSRWYADYLIERGITPDPEGLAWFEQNRKEDAMREARHPDLIISASGDWKRGVPKGSVEVTTADGQVYYVPDSEYKTRPALNLLLLSSFSNVTKAST